MFLRFGHLTWGARQGIEIIAQETGINPVEILVVPYSVRNVHIQFPKTMKLSSTYFTTSKALPKIIKICKPSS